MAVIKNKEKKLEKRIVPAKHGLTKHAKKILRKPWDTQPISSVAV